MKPFTPRLSAFATLTPSLVFALLAATPRPAAADDAGAWPQRPIRLIAGGAGSVTDIRARWLAERLGPALGQPVVVENKPAAGGNLGMAEVARSAADGHTLIVVHQGTMTLNPHLYAKPGYDALADFTPVTRFGIGPLMLAVHPDVPARSVAELVALAKAKPGQLNIGSPGIGTPPHLAGEVFERAAAIDAQHVPYNGGGALAAALIAGQVQFAVEGPTALGPHVRTGRLRALALTGPERMPAWPDLPTMAEAGFPGAEYRGWTGIAGPAKLPSAVVDKLHRAIAAIATTPQAREWFAAGAAEPGIESPAAFAASIREEHARWGRLIREANIRIE